MSIIYITDSSSQHRLTFTPLVTLGHLGTNLLEPPLLDSRNPTFAQHSVIPRQIQRTTFLHESNTATSSYPDDGDQEDEHEEEQCAQDDEKREEDIEKGDGTTAALRDILRVFGGRKGDLNAAVGGGDR